MIDEELIENFRTITLPFMANLLLRIDYEGQGTQDKEDFERDFNEILNLAIIGLNQTTQPEEKTGYWIDIDSETYTWKVRCSECGAERSMMSTQGVYPKFCEVCGTKMIGKKVAE